MGSFSRVGFEPVNPEQRTKNCTVPCYVGAFVLSYSRVIMDGHRKSFNPRGLMELMEYYTDTDSAFIRFCQMIGVDIGKLLGQMCNDLPNEAKILEMFGIRPKV